MRARLRSPRFWAVWRCVSMTRTANIRGGGYGEPGLTQPSMRSEETHSDSGVGLDQVVLGNPSYVWRFGQERRLEMLRRYVPLEGARMLDIGCGVGTYVRRFSDFTTSAYGMDIDPGR